jgi:hypothetical protein
LSSLGLPETDPGTYRPRSGFADGAQYRIEIPSVEGPVAFAAVVEAATQHQIRVHRSARAAA